MFSICSLKVIIMVIPKILLEMVLNKISDLSLFFYSNCVEPVTIRSMNSPSKSFGKLVNSSELYVTNDGKIQFYVKTPGLTGDSDSASFQSVDEGKYFVNHNGLLDLKAVEESEDFNKVATFKVRRQQFYNVSIIYLHLCSDIIFI